MNPGRPKISVLIPTYNYARFLPEAINSVLRQDFTDYELIVADDCSTDHTAEVLAPYAGRDPRLRIHRHQPNLGMVANWNWCLQQAKGEYIKYLFGDDTLAHPSALSRMAAMLDQNPGATLAASSRLTLDEHSAVTGLWDTLRRSGLYSGPVTIARCLADSTNHPGEPSVVLFRRSHAQRAFAPALRQIVDLEMWFHLLLQGDFVYTADPLCGFRVHGSQQTAVNRQNQTGDLEMAALLHTYLPLLNNHPLRPLTPWHRAVIVHRALLHLLKKNPRTPPIATAISTLRAQLPPLTRHLCTLGYRLRRPLENFNRSAHKRLLRHALRSGRYAEQTRFLGSLATESIP